MEVISRGFMRFREAAKPGLVKYRPSCHANRGPDLVLWEDT